ncbi:MAG: GNAT family N-acetyltransferase [Halobacteriovoraceae bacterium]|jgi:hypothetical protein|nr:GNAT family N-acetyltransferase [Halobacteriovoraceae bacterium]MBT5095171.1 GNAT family N-acetyltransferase [Halobacteriovoraceae bacterium]
MSATLTTLAKRPELLDQVIELIEKSFNYDSDQSYAVDFASLMDPSNHANCHLILKDDRPVAHIGLKLRNLAHRDWTSPICLLGGIAVTESERGSGHLDSLLSHVIDLHGDEVSLFILWSNLTELYQKYSFFEAGGVITTGEKILTKVEGFRETSFSKLSEQQLEQISKLYHTKILANCLTIERSTSDWQLLKKQKSTKLFIKEEANQITEYFCLSKGMDLKDTIHESSFFDQIDSPLEEYKFWIPHSPEMSYPQVHYAGFFKIGSPHQFTKLVNQISEQKIKKLELNSQQVLFHLEDEEQQFKVGHQDFLIGLLGPASFKEFSPFHKRIFIAGLDSI